MPYIKYKHRKTGKVYKKVVFYDHAPNLALVTTEAGSTYLVDRKQIVAVRGNS